MPAIQLGEACIEIHIDKPEDLLTSLETDFSRRYLPRINVLSSCSEKDAVIYWLRDKEFRVLSTLYSTHSHDIFVVQGEPPEPYVNESPVFFLLQVFARALAKRGHILLTDSVVIEGRGKNILLLGFPHTGKSTIATIAYSRGLNVYSTENTVIKPSESRLLFVNGTRVLVFDPIIIDKYGLQVEFTRRTRHGYGIIDLDENKEVAGSDKVISIDEIYVVYTNFSSTGCSIAPVKGRKIAKLIWYFATSLIKGLDYYTPIPLDIPLDETTSNTIRKLIDVVVNGYSNRFYEVFGSPLDVFESITRASSY